MNWILVLLTLLMTGCADTLIVAKDMDAASIWAAGGFVFLCCIGIAVVLNGWPQIIIRRTINKDKPETETKPE